MQGIAQRHWLAAVCPGVTGISQSNCMLLWFADDLRNGDRVVYAGAVGV